MNLFDQLVSDALKKQSHLSALRMVVEKELLHHDILRTMSDHQLLTNLTFIGGTCLRYCYGGTRLSEDLDFTGGSDFTKDNLTQMGEVLIQNLSRKYGLSVKVSEPVKDKKNVSTWKIKIETRPESKNLPTQRINIDICAVPSYERQPMLLINPYGIDMGTGGLILQAQSREEIYADKLIAFALRPNRLKYRDLWDIAWLHQQAIKPNLSLIPRKLQDRNQTFAHFLKLFQQRQQLLIEDKTLANEFVNEMRRFLPATQIKQMLQKNDLWEFIIYLLKDLAAQLTRS